MVGNRLNIFSDYDPWIMNLIICSLVAAVTEVTSNTATATLLMPILAELVRFKSIIHSVKIISKLLQKLVLLCRYILILSHLFPVVVLIW